MNDTGPDQSIQNGGFNASCDHRRGCRPVRPFIGANMLSMKDVLICNPAASMPRSSGKCVFHGSSSRSWPVPLSRCAEWSFRRFSAILWLTHRRWVSPPELRSGPPSISGWACRLVFWAYQGFRFLHLSGHYHLFISYGHYPGANTAPRYPGCF